MTNVLGVLVAGTTTTTTTAAAAVVVELFTPFPATAAVVDEVTVARPRLPLTVATILALALALALTLALAPTPRPGDAEGAREALRPFVPREAAPRDREAEAEREAVREAEAEAERVAVRRGLEEGMGVRETMTVVPFIVVPLLEPTETDGEM